VGLIVIAVVIVILVRGGDGGGLIEATATSKGDQPVPTIEGEPGFLFLSPQNRSETGWSEFDTLVGDVNGDGRDDLIWNMTREINRTYVGLGLADGAFEFLQVQDREERIWGGFEALVGDVNGDGRSDLIWNETAETNRTYVGLGQASGAFQFMPAQDREERYWSGFQAFLGDVNGDGRSDLIWNETAETNRTYVGLGQVNGAFQFMPAQDRPEQEWLGFTTLVGDINGDGRTDLIWNETAETNRIYTAIAREDGTFNFLPGQDHPKKGWENFQVLVGDINGDGRGDLIWNRTEELNRIYVGLGQQDGTFQFLQAQDRPERTWNSFVTLSGDVNGDGRTDLIWNETAETNRIYVGLAQEDGTFEFLAAKDHTETGWSNFRALVGDVNGDGRSDLIWNRAQNANRIFVGLGNY
jgi:hypothetical protein